MSRVCCIHGSAKTDALSLAVPLWNFAGNLESLTLQMSSTPAGWTRHPGEVHELQYQPVGPPADAQLDLGPDPPADDDPEAFAALDEVETQHLYVQSKTIVEAAKGGRLKELHLANYEQQPFAIRALVPQWVNLRLCHIMQGPEEDWLLAAVFLRPTLSHASKWLGMELKQGERHDRHLTRQEIQSILQYFQDGSDFPLDITSLRAGVLHPIVRYLRWLEESDELAQEAADVWNAGVKRGEADEAGCRCKACYTPPPPPPQRTPASRKRRGGEAQEADAEDDDDEQWGKEIVNPANAAEEEGVAAA